jgi:hypothetical protein
MKKIAVRASSESNVVLESPSWIYWNKLLTSRRVKVISQGPRNLQDPFIFKIPEDWESTGVVTEDNLQEARRLLGFFPS